MKKIFSFFLVLLAGSSLAQTYTLSSDSINLTVPFSTVQSDQFYILSLDATLTNTTADTVPSAWTRTIQYLTPGWEESVCDPILCHGQGLASSSFNFLPNLTAAVRVDLYPHQTSGYGIVNLNFYRQGVSSDYDEGVFVGVVDAGSGISSFEQISDFKIFQNPANGELIIISETELNPVSIEVYDLLGKKMSIFISKESNSLFSINLNTLNSGYYFLRIKMKDGSFITKKFVNQRR